MSEYCTCYDNGNRPALLTDWRKTNICQSCMRPRKPTVVQAGMRTGRVHKAFTVYLGSLNFDVITDTMWDAENDGGTITRQEYLDTLTWVVRDLKAYLEGK